MNVKQIETFYWVVRLGSFRAAADRLSTTQSTVSMRVMQLEKDIGMALFDRTRRNARLTQKGRALVHRLIRSVHEDMKSTNVFKLLESVRVNHSSVSVH
jgi:DNA-binding transcriptional LysR family regulator